MARISSGSCYPTIVPVDRQSNQTTSNSPLEAALEYARRRIPVFPCRPAPDKSPLTGEGGFHNATTDEKKVRAWWTRYPGASIGVPTGARSGWWVLDVDRLEALEELEREHGKLPVTLIARTPSGGFHIYFQYVEGITNSPGGLPKGIDVRGQGGYVLVPPSQGYTVLDDTPPAEAPEWLLELVRTKPQSSGGSPTPADPSPFTADIEGPPIPYGSRNITLTRIAGKLHNGSRSFDQLLIDLEAVNQRRCQPPLGDHPSDRPDEVARIARSIIRRPACKQAAPEVGPEVREELEQIELENLWGRMWKGRKLKVARSVFATLILAARHYGKRIPVGIRVSLSERDLALRAGLSRRAIEAAIRTLRLEHGLIRKDDHGRHAADSGAFVLLSLDEVDRTTSRAKYSHSPTRGVLVGGKRLGGSGHTLRGPRLRCSSPGTGKRLRGTIPGTSKVREGPAPEERDPLIRLDKAAEEVIDWLDACGGTLGLEELAEIVGCRLRDLRGRVIAKLQEAGVVLVEGDSVALVEDWLERLDEDRERAGEFEAHERDKARYEREREQYRRSLGKVTVEHREGEAPESVKADGYVGDLEVPHKAEENVEVVDAILSEEEVFDLAREVFNLPPAPPRPGAAQEPSAPKGMLPTLSEEDDVDVLVAICAFEEKFGRGSFEWNRAGAKKLFYQIKPGYWPEAHQLARLREYVGSAGGLDRVREHLHRAGVAA